MGNMYAMQRANGDWFSLDDRGRFRVLCFAAVGTGCWARVSHWGMNLFKPVMLNERALNDFVPAAVSDDVYFWLVDAPFTDLNRGRELDRAQLTLLVHDAAQHARA